MNAGEILRAMAQVFTDYPERWTTGVFARERDGSLASIRSRHAYCFCASGFLLRAVAERLIDDATKAEAERLLARECVIGSISYTNDNLGIKAIIDAANCAALKGGLEK